MKTTRKCHFKSTSRGSREYWRVQKYGDTNTSLAFGTLVKLISCLNEMDIRKIKCFEEIKLEKEKYIYSYSYIKYIPITSVYGHTI